MVFPLLVLLFLEGLFVRVNSVSPLCYPYTWCSERIELPRLEGLTMFERLEWLDDEEGQYREMELAGGYRLYEGYHRAVCSLDPDHLDFIVLMTQQMNVLLRPQDSFGLPYNSIHTSLWSRLEKIGISRNFPGPRLTSLHAQVFIPFHPAT